MSKTRQENIAKLSANMPETEEQHPQEQAEESPKLELNTQRQITRLEKALEVVKSQKVKSKLKEEIELVKIHKEEEAQKKKEELDTLQTAQTGVKIAGNVATGISSTASNIAGKAMELGNSTTSTLATVATPGSIFLPIALLLLFFFLILPVNGMTRAQWLWLALTGNARVQSSAGEQSGAVPATGSGDTEPPPSSNGSYKVSNYYINPYIRRKPS